MLDLQKLLGQVLGSGAPAPRGDAGSRPFGGQGLEGQITDLVRRHGPTLLSSGLAGGLAGRMFKGKHIGKLGGTAVKLGGAALIAGLAYRAWQTYQAQSGAAAGTAGATAGPPGFLPASARAALPTPEGTAFLPRGAEEERARLMLSAMIAAAKADGHIDAAEQAAIFERIDGLDLDAEEKGFLMDEMRRPLSIDALAERATTPEIATEVYAASLLAIDPDHPAETAYLDHLAARLALPPRLVDAIRRTADEAAAAAETP